MRVALVLVLLVGCAAEKKAATAGGPATESGGSAAANTGSAPDNSPVTTTPQEAPKLDQQGDMQAKGGGGAQPGGSPPPDGVTRGKGNAVDAARSGGMLGPADQRAFQANGKVSIKKFSSKDLDAAVKPQLDALKGCYDKALEFAEQLAGELTITVKDGKATVSKSTLKNAELEKCVVDALQAATLPKPKATLVLAFKRE